MAKKTDAAFETKRVKFIPGIAGKRGDGALQKYLADGWELVTVDKRVLSKSTAILRRPKV